MSDYKRLTKTEKINQYCSTVECAEHCEDCYVGKLYERLAELEDDLESGKLIRLSCKVGDKVYILGSKEDSDKVEIFEDVVIEILVRYFGDIKVERIKVSKFGATGILPLCTLNKDWFLTKAEAEAKLKEINDGK